MRGDSLESPPVYTLWVMYPHTDVLVEAVLDEDVDTLCRNGEFGMGDCRWVKWLVTDPFGLVVDGGEG